MTAKTDEDWSEDCPIALLVLSLKTTFFIPKEEIIIEMEFQADKGIKYFSSMVETKFNQHFWTLFVKKTFIWVH